MNRRITRVIAGEAVDRMAAAKYDELNKAVEAIDNHDHE